MMKIKTKLSVLLLVMITAFSCEDLDELTEFDITEDFTTTYNISVPEDSEGMPQSFSESATIDIAENEEIQDNLDLLQDVTLNSLSYEIANFSGAQDATLTEATLNFGSVSISISNINLQQSDIDNTIYEIADTSLLNAIADALENNIAINASVTGTVSATPVVFDIIINLDVTATVDVL
ncbi:hypothetical protein DFQ10_101871 [Winogradskyella eximia]|uniref:Uncharacterized protein n=1 Tax=Winogradskyella eximia TaxID=262006 RepID=A0A3D9HC89_9FLAO|nr:hypothetical protein [Winogradskyella eximia]RED47090.1 hypothetical protein DFQ10_101871 [Winogradskyella eximia]